MTQTRLRHVMARPVRLRDACGEEGFSMHYARMFLLSRWSLPAGIFLLLMLCILLEVVV